MTVTLKSLYAQLGQLLEEMPDLAAPGAVTREANKWMARAAVLVGQTGDRVAAQFVADRRSQHEHRPAAARQCAGIAAIVHRALATVEAQLPAGARGSFIAAGSVFDAYQGVRERYWSRQRRTYLIIDRIAGFRGPRIRAGDAGSGSWCPRHRSPYAKIAQAGGRKVVEAIRPAACLGCSAAPKALHDRLIIVDQKTVWNVGQSSTLRRCRRLATSRFEAPESLRKDQSVLGDVERVFFPIAASQAKVPLARLVAPDRRHRRDNSVLPALRD